MISFNEQNRKLTLSQEHDALDFTVNAFDKPDDYIYVLDTNALIQIFQLDSDSFQILEKQFNSKRYFGTRQIEIEFLRNKDYTSNYFLIDLTKKMTSDFEIHVSSKLREFIKNYTHILSTENVIAKKIKRYATSTKTIQSELQKTETQFTAVKAKTIISKTIRLITDNIDFSTQLDIEDYPVLEKEYSELVARNIRLYGDKKEFNKEYRAYVFPGMGEKKAINPEGDYYIFHELIQLASKNKKNICFLTNDTSKADWIDTKTGRNYEHYQSIFYALSKQALKVENFNAFLNTDLGIKTEKLLEIDEFDYDDGFIGQYLMRWSQFERYIREWSIKQGYSAQVNIKKMLYHAHGTEKLSKELFEKFLPLNEMRNNLVHGYYYKYQSLPEIEKESILDQLEDFITIFMREA